MDAATTTGQITIGQSGIATAPLGVGTWAWGDRRLWNYGKGYGREDVAGAFAASVAGMTSLLVQGPTLKHAAFGRRGYLPASSALARCVRPARTPPRWRRAAGQRTRTMEVIPLDPIAKVGEPLTLGCQFATSAP